MAWAGGASSAGLADYRRPQLLDPSRHDRSAFECGDASLDEWLTRCAGQSRRAHTTATWVIVDADDVMVAYASLAMTTVDRSAAPRPVAKGGPDPVPALLIGRLAVDRQHAGQGLGTALVAHALATGVDVNQRAACRAVVVTAINQHSRVWWEDFGFEPLDPGDPESLDLYLLTSDIEKTLHDMR